MRRRDFIAVGIVAATRPISAWAQQPSSRPIIGFLRNTSPDESRYLVAALRKGLAEAGFVDRKDVTIEYRWGNGHQDQLQRLAADLVSRQVALIVAGGDASVIAAKAVTTRVPIVFATGEDPVKLGFVRSLNWPGGTVTGVTFLSNTLRTKQLELLHELVPGATVIAMLVNSKIPSVEDHIAEQQAAARSLGLNIKVVRATSETDFEQAFANIAASRAGALYVDGDSLFTGLRARLAALANGHGIPTVFNERESAIAGGLMSYGASIPDAYRQAGVYVGRILKGEKPAELPVQQPTKFNLVINLKTAKSLGLTVPVSLLASADELIE